MGQRILSELGMIQDIVDQDSSIFLVTGRRSYELSGAKAIIEEVLGVFPVEHFDEFSVNPKIEDIQEGIERYKKSGSNTIIAIGGGSAIDVAKAIFVLSSQESTDYEAMVRNNKAEADLEGKFIAVPTTAGTGSESTHFAVIYIDGTKFSLSHKDSVADVAVLDPRMTASLPASIAAASGMDAIAQATEAFWSVNSTEESRQFSRRALKLLLPAIKTATNEADLKSREAMLRGSNLAGRAINLAKTTACHAVSYPMTSEFGIPHGHAVALTLPSFIEFNDGIDAESSQDDRGYEYVEGIMSELFSIFGVSSSAEARLRIESLIDSVGLERDFKKLGIYEAEIEYIVENGFNPQRVKNNPRKLSKGQLHGILAAI